MLLSDPFDVLQGDVVDLAADAFHGVLGCGRDVGATLPPQVFQAVLRGRETPGQAPGAGVGGLSDPNCPRPEQALLLTNCVTWTNPLASLNLIAQQLREHKILT